MPFTGFISKSDYPAATVRLMNTTNTTSHSLNQVAYFLVHSLAVSSYLDLSVLYTCAISGTKGSSGLGSVSIEQIERRTIMVSSQNLDF